MGICILLSIFFRYFIMCMHYFYSASKNYNINRELDQLILWNETILRKTSVKKWEVVESVCNGHKIAFLFSPDSLFANVFRFMSCHHPTHEPMWWKELKLRSNAELGYDLQFAAPLCTSGTLTSLSLSFFMGIIMLKFTGYCGDKWVGKCKVPIVPLSASDFVYL